MNIRLPETVNRILDTLHAHGFEAYAVGGCVRDALLGRTPQDWDITTSARPEEVKRLFPKTVDTGIAHGTVTVLLGGAAHEVTTYRVDGAYADGRHPDSVTFTASLAEDLLRRDFTINAMAYSPEEGLVDLYNGAGDLQRRVIRCVGDPAARFSEDALRMLRAERFSAQLGFAIEQKTEAAVRLLAPTLKKISAERICQELTKLLTSDHPEQLRQAYEAGITAVILPEFDRMMETEQHNPHHMYSVGEHTLAALAAVRADRVLRFTMLLHDMGKPAARTTDAAGVDHFKGHAAISADMAGRILRRLKTDNDTVRAVKTLITYHDWRVEPQAAQVRRWMNRVGPALCPLLLEVQRADTMAQSPWKREEKLARIAAVEALYGEILAKDQCVTLKGLAVTGQDLMALGIPKGPAVGRWLQACLERVLASPEENTKPALLAFVRAGAQPEMSAAQPKILAVE